MRKSSINVACLNDCPVVTGRKMMPLMKIESLDNLIKGELVFQSRSFSWFIL